MDRNPKEEFEFIKATKGDFKKLKTIQDGDLFPRSKVDKTSIVVEDLAWWRVHEFL